MTMSKILVLGSNSFSGASFVAHSLERGAQVTGISRSDEPASAFLPYKWQPHGNFAFHHLDLNQHLADIIKLVAEVRPDYIVNFAAQSMVGESWQNPGDWFLTNTLSTVKLHDALRKFDFLQRYVHISTPEVYGSCSGGVAENQAFHPSTPYAVSRAAADMSLASFHAAYGFPVVTTRAANVFGPGQQLYRIIPRTILYILLGRRLQLHGGGTSTRSFIHIRDVADATWKIMRHGTNGQTYHISTPQTISIRGLVETICELMGVRFEDHVDIVGERLGKDAAYHLDSSKLRRELGWSDTTTLSDGLSECIDWVNRHRNVLAHLPLDYIHKP